MEKLLAGKCSQELWFGILISFAMCFVFLCFDFSTFWAVNNEANLLVTKEVDPIGILNFNQTRDSCSDRYIYIHEGLPSRFNYDFLDNCESLSAGTSISNIPSMCPHLVNLGLGPEINSSEGVLSNKSWFKTNPYLLEVIFHNRMKNYECLTKNFTLASAIYVPFYPSMDVGVHLWDSNLTIRDSSAKHFAKWLSRQPEWSKMWGETISLLLGGLLGISGGKETIALLGVVTQVEKRHCNSIPHKLSSVKDSEVVQWQNRVREQERPYLFTFAGAPRPNQNGSIRGKLIDHCQASTKCKFLHCTEKKCGNPVTVMRVFQSSVYCLQPEGDSFTRRSAFDAFLAGCIPVFFHPATAYTQYLWYLPKDHTKYSVFIPVRDVKDLKEGQIENVLLGISKDQEAAMREEVIRLIPKLVYADPRSRLETQDAFDIAVQGILERVENVRKVIREGRDPSIGFADEDNGKFKFPETIDS
ncbi:putative xyloglucan galactosyltransferase GT14 [Prunus yedoensis var. nudiflora]|uniref:Putative xyloglucan galactosyltransferase GT14 n=1 Tax=Prunus yedoensis var. nudiflora TaxID=2094558 RepID=A0A314UEB9_PRUYE|nr:putative xyloglucan galactosyltransferase GT14 [Prunus yedoensis var. nudiflora]